MPSYKILRGSITLDGVQYTKDMEIELEEDHAGRFPAGFLQLLDIPMPESIIGMDIKTSARRKR